jgi:hypothetical protein
LDATKASSVCFATFRRTCDVLNFPHGRSALWTSARIGRAAGGKDRHQRRRRRAGRESIRANTGFAFCINSNSREFFVSDSFFGSADPAGYRRKSHFAAETATTRY